MNTMLLLRKLFKLLGIKTINMPSNYYDFSIETDIPNAPKPNHIYIIKEGNEADSLFFKCPCGCNGNITLNLLQDTSPSWYYEITNNKLTISPSISRLVGCKSHFFISNGKVRWAKN